MKKVIQNDNFIGLALALASFLVYLSTMAPSLCFIDSGELATDISTLGIAHPTGYPLFTLVGWVFIHLIPFGRVIWKLNLFAAVCCSVSVFGFYRLFLFLLAEKTLIGFGIRQESSGRKKGKAVESKPLGSTERIAAGIAALILAFSETFWSQAVSIEVYPLHLVFLSLVILLFVRAILEYSENHEKKKSGTWIVFALALGLAFSNHMTTILLAPAFLYLYFATHGFSRPSWFKISKAAIPFIAGLSVYLYLPLRAAQHPLMNWGNPVTFERFMWHISGKQFRSWMFSSWDSAGKQFGYFLSSYPSEFGYAPLLFALLGLTVLFRRSKKLLIFSLLLFFGCLFYSINYDIHDIDSYFLLAYVATAIWIAYGVQSFLGYMRNGAKKWIGLAACVALVLLPLGIHYRSIDESKDYAVEDYTKNLLGSLDSNAVILSYQWDAFVSAAYYLQRVEGFRSDVVVIDKELCRRSWYPVQLEHQFPWLIQNSRPEVNAFLQAVAPFEHDEPFNPNVIEASFEGMIQSFLIKSSETRPVYVTSDIGPEFTPGFRRLPSGLSFRLSRDTALIPIAPREFFIRPFTKTNSYAEGVKAMYAEGYANQGIYQSMLGNKAEAIVQLKKALEVKPDFQPAQAWLQRLSGS